MKLMEKCKTWNKIWYLIAALVLMICLYAVGCYPLYTGQKTRTMKRLYREMQEMDLNDLDDDDLETLNEFQKEKFEVMIVNEKLDQIYTSRSAAPKDYINKQFGSRLDKYTEKKSGIASGIDFAGKSHPGRSDILCLCEKRCTVRAGYHSGNGNLFFDCINADCGWLVSMHEKRREEQKETVQEVRVSVTGKSERVYGEYIS